MFLDNLLQPTHLLIILAVALIVLGPKRLPEVGHALGRGLRDFKDAISGERDEDHAEVLSPQIPESQHSSPAAAQPMATPEPTATPEPLAAPQPVATPQAGRAPSAEPPSNAPTPADKPTGQ